MDEDQRHAPVERPTAGMMLTERKRIMFLPPSDALEAIIDSPHAAALVESFPEEDLHLLIHEIGIEDALPLLAMASDSQWTFFLDIETWEEDRFEVTSFTGWLNHLMAADPDRLVGRFLEDHLEDMELYLSSSITVAVREHDEDPSVFGEDYFTHDDQFYIRIVDDPPDAEPEERYQDSRKEVIMGLLKRLANYDHLRYQKILLEAASVIPSETEEEMYRMRNVRLAEKGFLPFDDAIGIYQPLSSGEMAGMGENRGVGIGIEDIPLSVSYLPVEIAESGSLFADALALITSEERQLEIQAEMAGLSNRIISADKLRISERVQLDDVVKKACGYIGIGLEKLLSESGGTDPHRAAAWLAEHPLSNLFRIGYGLVLAVGWKAERWHGESWAAKNGLSLAFWGEHWLGVLGGLLIDRPLFYGNYETGVLYREFSTLEDIQQTERTLGEVMAYDDLLSQISVPIPPSLPQGILSHKNVTLTLWARARLGLSRELTPVPIDDFRQLFDQLWATHGKDGSAIRSSVKTSFLDWLSDATGSTRIEITRELGAVFDGLFEEIEREYGNVASEDIDPKYTQMFPIGLGVCC